MVLLDEVEKAHPDVHEIFFQVFDKGFMEDGEGRFIDFKNTLILLTTNAGTELIASLCKDPELMPEPEGMAKALREPLLKVFPPALLGRLVAIPVLPADATRCSGRSSSCSSTASRSGSRRATRFRSSTATTWSSWWCRAAPRANRAAA